MLIKILPNGWGDTNPSDIEPLLQDTASHINRELSSPFNEKIEVKHGQSPFACHRDEDKQTENDPHTIILSATNNQWDCFAYQFAHEFCHLLSDHERLHENKNGWFHEAICELASVFTLQRMAERWQDRPPFGNWRDYAGELKKYEEGIRKSYSKELEKNFGCQSARELIQIHEEEMRENAVARNTNGDRHERYRPVYALIAYTLLPVFEDDPFGWNAIRKLPSSKVGIWEYLDEWKESIGNSDNKKFIERCIECLNDLSSENPLGIENTL